MFHPARPVHFLSKCAHSPVLRASSRSLRIFSKKGEKNIYDTLLRGRVKSVQSTIENLAIGATLGSIRPIASAFATG